MLPGGNDIRVRGNEFAKGIYENSRCTRFLGKLVIPDLCKNKMLKGLDVLGVNEKAVFPALDGIGRYIERFYRSNPEDILEYI